MITPNDIAAMSDVLDQVSESSDSLTVEQAVDLLRSVQTMVKNARVTMGLLEQQLVATLESPRVFDGVMYAVEDDGTWRPDHSTIKGLVKGAAAVDEHGELRHPADAAEAAVNLMYDLFVSPSTFPKTGGIDQLGTKKSVVGHYELKGRKVTTKEVPDGVEKDA